MSFFEERLHLHGKKKEVLSGLQEAAWVALFVTPIVLIEFSIPILLAYRPPITYWFFTHGFLGG